MECSIPPAGSKFPAVINMPGIAGLISFSPSLLNASIVQEMIGTMRHESSYISGSQVFDRLSVAWTAHPESTPLPVWNPTRDVCLIFSGECFGKEISAAKDILRLYETLGLPFLEKLNGWFSGLIVDIRSNLSFLFNDRYGLGRIYFHQTANALYFASEAKALLRVLPALRKLNLTGLAEQFSCGCVLQNRTLFEGISLLPGGSVWTFSSNTGIKKETYFQPALWEDQAPLDASAYYSALREVFPSLLSPYLNGGSKVGMSLTGGLDGRMIMAWARPEPGSLPCYSFGGVYRDCVDVKLARRIAALSGQSHQVIPVDDRFLRDFLPLAEKSVRISDGTMDVSGAVELFANRFARQIAPVRLTGNYGSEILRGNVAFRPGANDLDLLTPDFSSLLSNAAETYAAEARGNRTSFIAFKQVPWHHYSRLSVEQSQLTLRSPFLDNELVRLVYRAPKEMIDSPASALRLVADGNATLGNLPTDRGLLLRPKALTRVNNAWQETTVRAEYAYDYGMPQWLAKVDHLLSPLHLERLFLGRHKFYHFRVWYRDQLAPCVKEVLLDSGSLARPYLKKRQVEKMVNEHTNGQRNHTRSIHKLLTAELTQRQLLEQ